jgi:hypothetical protein
VSAEDVTNVFDICLEQIEQADLPATVYRTAIRLLRRAINGGGTFTLEEADLLDICQTDAEGTARSHLVQLAAAGIIRYKRRGFVSITFLAWTLDEDILIAQRSLLSQNEEIRALSDQNIESTSAILIAERSNSDEEAPIRALSDQKARAERSDSVKSDIKVIAERSERALSDQNEPSTSHTRARSGRWVGRSRSSREKRKKPTYPPTSHNATPLRGGVNHDPPLNAMQQLALDLLEDSDVGVLHETALMLVREKSAQDIFRAVDKWLPDAQARKVGPGVLKHRIETLKPSRAATVALSATFLVSDLFQRHRLPDEMIAGPPRREYGKYTTYRDDQP